MPEPSKVADGVTERVISARSSKLTAQQIVQNYSADEWETFIGEWAEGFAPPYAQIVRLGGAGDKGRDVVAHVTDPALRGAEWDNYQCKHYDHALYPSDIFVELGKLCFCCHSGDYDPPRRYRFVAPFGVGTKLFDLLSKPELLRAELIANWDKNCRANITGTSDVLLEGELLKFVQEFDFKKVWFLTPSEIIAQHERTKYWHRRFDFDRPDRPENPPVPDAIQSYELTYISRLLEAYSSHLQQPIASVDALGPTPKLGRHLTRSRGYFFSAEALGRFSRDHFKPRAFDVVKGHVHDAVVDVASQAYADGLACVDKVTEVAIVAQLPDSDLRPYLEPGDRKGLCHHLANDGKLKWVPDGE